jgi:hypothetical protein
MSYRAQVSGMPERPSYAADNDCSRVASEAMEGHALLMADIGQLWSDRWES